MAPASEGVAMPWKMAASTPMINRTVGMIDTRTSAVSIDLVTRRTPETTKPTMATVSATVRLEIDRITSASRPDRMTAIVSEWTSVRSPFSVRCSFGIAGPTSGLR